MDNSELSLSPILTDGLYDWTRMARFVRLVLYVNPHLFLSDLLIFFVIAVLCIVPVPLIQLDGIVLATEHLQSTSLKFSVVQEISVKHDNCTPRPEKMSSANGGHPLFEKGESVLLEGLARAPHLNERAATVS
jgi:hypothetical protein